MRPNFLLTILGMLLATTFAAPAPLIAECMETSWFTELAPREPGDLATRSGPQTPLWKYRFGIAASGPPLNTNFAWSILVSFVPEFRLIWAAPVFKSADITQADTAVTLDLKSDIAPPDSTVKVTLHWVLVFDRAGSGQDFVGLRTQKTEGASTMWAMLVDRTA